MFYLAFLLVYLNNNSYRDYFLRRMVYSIHVYLPQDVFSWLAGVVSKFVGLKNDVYFLFYAKVLLNIREYANKIIYIF